MCSAKKTIKKLGEGVYSEVFYFQDSSEKLVVKVTSSQIIMCLHGSKHHVYFLYHLDYSCGRKDII